MTASREGIPTIPEIKNNLQAEVLARVLHRKAKLFPGDLVVKTIHDPKTPFNSALVLVDASLSPDSSAGSDTVANVVIATMQRFKDANETAEPDAHKLMQVWFADPMAIPQLRTFMGSSDEKRGRVRKELLGGLGSIDDVRAAQAQCDIMMASGIHHDDFPEVVRRLARYDINRTEEIIAHIVSVGNRLADKEKGPQRKNSRLFDAALASSRVAIANGQYDRAMQLCESGPEDPERKHWLKKIVLEEVIEAAPYEQLGVYITSADDLIRNTSGTSQGGIELRDKMRHDYAYAVLRKEDITNNITSQLKAKEWITGIEALQKPDAGKMLVAAFGSVDSFAGFVVDQWINEKRRSEFLYRFVGEGTTAEFAPLGLFYDFIASIKAGHMEISENIISAIIVSLSQREAQRLISETVEAGLQRKQGGPIKVGGLTENERIYLYSLLENSKIRTLYGKEGACFDSQPFLDLITTITEERILPSGGFGGF